MKGGKSSKIEWQFFPRRSMIPDFLRNIVSIFEDPQNSSILSLDECDESNFLQLSSNQVLGVLSKSLSESGLIVETGKTASEKYTVPVLFGKNGAMTVSYDVDGYDPINKVVLEVEAGQAMQNNHVALDLLKCCVMVDVDYAVIAVRRIYRYKKNKDATKYTKGYDFRRAYNLLDTLYSSGRLELPLKGVLIIGY